MNLPQKIVGFLLLLLPACIPLSDGFPPSIDVAFPEGEIDVEPIYYQDSIVLKVAYTDNVALNKWKLEINRLELKDIDADWRYVREEEIAGNARGAQVDITVNIPSRTNEKYISTGDYELLLTIFDIDSNFNIFPDTFNIGGDISAPQFLNLTANISSNLPPNAPANADYIACPTLPIYFFGNVTDNTKLRRIGFSYGNFGDASFPIRTSTYEYDTVGVESYLNDSLLIQLPADLNKSLVSLNLFAEDIFNNRYDTTFQVYLDCDASPPLLTYSSLSNELVNGIASVVEGLDFQIEDLRIEDNEALRNLEVYLYPIGESPVLWEEYAFGGRVADTLFQPFIVPSSELEVGESYILSFVAHDTTTVFLPNGNEGRLAFELSIRADEAPAISSMDFIVNEETASTQVFLGQRPGDTLALSGILASEPLSILVPDGKAIDDVGITQLTMVWHQPDGLSVEVVSSSFATPPDVIKFLDFYNRSSAFSMDRVGLYRLEVILEDTKGQINSPASRSYYFLVE